MNKSYTVLSYEILSMQCGLTQSFHGFAIEREAKSIEIHEIINNRDKSIKNYP